MRSSVYMTAIAVLLAALTLLGQVHGQSYHYSNGWQPGKRSQETCRFRTEVKTLIFKLIEDEVFRMLTDQSCYGSISAFKNILKKEVYPPLDVK